MKMNRLIPMLPVRSMPASVDFYEKLGFTQFGTLQDYPPGHSQIYFCKRFDCPTGPAL